MSGGDKKDDDGGMDEVSSWGNTGLDAVENLINGSGGSTGSYSTDDSDDDDEDSEDDD